MPTVVTDFDPVSIKNMNIKFQGDATASKFGCIGKIDGQTELLEIVKKCEGIEVKKKSIPQKMKLKITAHVPVSTVRSTFGLSNSGLKPGVYSYGSASKGLPFILTADVIDEFEDVTKIIAFPNCSSATGLTLSVENGADTVAELEMEFTAMVDENKNFYYEAFLTELEDATLADTWRTNFTSSLVKVVTIP